MLDDGSTMSERHYDLAADPSERTPLEGAPYAELRAVAGRYAATAAAPAPPPPAAAIDDAERAELERQMKLLGYL